MALPEDFLSPLSFFPDFSAVGSESATISPAFTPEASTIVDSLCLESCTTRGSNRPFFRCTNTVGLPPFWKMACAGTCSASGIFSTMISTSASSPGRSSAWSCESCSGGEGSLALFRSSSVNRDAL